MNSSPEPMLMAENFVSMMTSGPIVSMVSRSDWSSPRISDVLPTIDMMPMTTPRIVSPDRAFWSRSVATAIVTISPNRPP